MKGFVNLIKESGMTSFDVVNKVKRKFNVPCGHMGTLDPMASGVLAVGIGFDAVNKQAACKGAGINQSDVKMRVVAHQHCAVGAMNLHLNVAQRVVGVDSLVEDRFCSHIRAIF